MKVGFCSSLGRHDGLSDFLALGIKTLAGLVLVVLPNQHSYKKESDCLPSPLATAGWFIVAIGLPVGGKNRTFFFFCMRCSWCPVPCVMHCPTERVGTLLLVSWLGKCGCAATAPLYRSVQGLGFGFLWAWYKAARDGEQ